MMRWNRIVNSIDHKDKIAKALLTTYLAGCASGVGCLLENWIGPTWHRRERSSRVRSYHTVLLLTNSKTLVSNPHVIKFKWPEKFVDNWVPCKIALKTLFVVITKSEFWIVLLGVHRHVECEYVVIDQVLIHHAVEEGSKVSLSHWWICKTNDSVEASWKDCFLCHVPKLKRVD